MGRLRRTVNKWNGLYGLLVQGLDGLSARVLGLEQRQHDRDRAIEAELDREQQQLLGEG